MVAESTAGIRPGDRGKVGGNWCRQPLTAAQAAGGISHQFLWPESCPVSQEHEEVNCAARREIETAAEPSQAHGEFRPVRRRSYPEGFGCYCADQNAVARPGGPTPPKGPARSRGRGAQGRRGGGERANLAKFVKPPQTRGGVKNRVTPLQERKQPER
jgi:hypothetical protein